MTVSEIGGSAGTTILVENLFFNVPARRKFLKKDQTELNNIVQEFERMVLVNPSVGFTFSNNGSLVATYPAGTTLQRIVSVFGKKLSPLLLNVEVDALICHLTGFVGKPDSARKTLGNQYFFVGGRFFRSAYLHKAVMKAYEEMIPEGVTPSYFIFLDIDPHSIDVNIHPTKTEIKFEDDSVIFQILYACVKETLGRNSFGAGIDFDPEGAVDLPQLGRSFDEYKGGVQAPQMQMDPDYDPFNFGSMAGPSTGSGSGNAAGSGAGYQMAPNYDFSRHVEPSQNYGALFAERTLPGARTMIIQGKYILTPVNSGVMVVNVRRARERILYERALDALTGQQHVTQTALFPVQVQVGAQQLLLFSQNADILSRLGFDISAFGTDSVVVNGVPEGYSCEPGKVQQMVLDLALVLEDGSSLEEVMRQQMASRFATLGASGADRLSDPMEAQRLIDTLFGCNNAELTPAGKRIVSIMSVDELEKRF